MARTLPNFGVRLFVGQKSFTVVGEHLLPPLILGHAAASWLAPGQGTGERRRAFWAAAHAWQRSADRQWRGGVGVREGERCGNESKNHSTKGVSRFLLVTFSKGGTAPTRHHVRLGAGDGDGCYAGGCHSRIVDGSISAEVAARIMLP